MRLRGLESGYADKHRAMREVERNFYGYSPQPTSRRTRTELHQGQAIREEQRLERGAQPSAEEENNFIDENGWEAFAKWHLAYDTEASEETKSCYKFPFGDFKKLHRSALVAAKQRAGSVDYKDVQSAFDRLL